ncbi:MAG TPA: DNA polymerase III subunit delta' C-terminal domain-containing protein [Buchnera sp. (in: enterobacteria)]|nr:DNA polymerase III subunit delta' C-terminal domain-containing protein [Buchnera sp. (in: enterobacteria)]
MVKKNKKMNLYSWHKKIYLEIVKQHNNKRNHHARMIISDQNLDIIKLVWNIAKWILCLKKKKCEVCNSCLLMDSNSHPDWYHIKKENHENKIGIDFISSLKRKVLLTSQQKVGKVIFFQNSENLTVSSINSLLKIIEEPPKNTWFFFEYNNNYYIPKTLKSRCLLHFLPPPTEKEGVIWLKNQSLKTKKNNYLILLRTCNNSPIESKKLFESIFWKLRIEFFFLLKEFIKNGTIKSIISIFSKKDNFLFINSICCFLLDTIKYKHNLKKNLVNLDQIKLINFLSKNCTFEGLNKSFKSWIRCYNRIISIAGINQELLIVEQFLYWKKILNL